MEQTTSMLQSEVLSLIGENKISQAILTLQKFIDENNLNKTKFSRNLTSIRRRLIELNGINAKGVLHFDQYILTKNKLVDSLIILLDDLDVLSNSDKEIEASEVTSTDIWVVIKGNLEEFDDERKQEFLSKIEKALKIESEIKIKQIIPGSIQILLNLPIGSAIRFYKMLKEGRMDNLNITDAYFSNEELIVTEFDSFKYNDEINYKEIGFRLGLLADEEIKNRLILRFKSLYEEKIQKEEKEFIRIEENLKRQFDYLNNLIRTKNSELSILNNRTSEWQERISRLNQELIFASEFLRKDIDNLRKRKWKWKNKVLKIAEEIEKGFAYGYTQRKINAASNKL